MSAAKERDMHALISAIVRDQDGVRGTVMPVPSQSPSNATHVRVRLEGGQQVVVPVNALTPQPDGSYYLPLSLAALEHADSTRHAG